jgi:hypothetical protein
MKFSQRLCDAKLGRAPIAIAAAKNQVPQRKMAASLRARETTPARQSTHSAAAT